MKKIKSNKNTKIRSLKSPSKKKHHVWKELLPKKEKSRDGVKAKH